MGRMWGSSRFMSPEEYELGAKLDEVTNVYTLGAAIFSILCDSDRDESVWPLSSESYHVALKATEPIREKRYLSIAALISAWKRSLSVNFTSKFPQNMV